MATKNEAVKAFAKGGVVSAPTYFPTSADLGLAGEARPEAIVPLSRGADGRLGLAGGVGAVNVTFNVTANDARSLRRARRRSRRCNCGR